MVPDLRKAFNQSFTTEKYEAFLADLHSKYPGAIAVSYTHLTLPTILRV